MKIFDSITIHECSFDKFVSLMKQLNLKPIKDWINEGRYEDWLNLELRDEKINITWFIANSDKEKWQSLCCEENKTIENKKKASKVKFIKRYDSLSDIYS